jgi:hypothetical protein
MSLLVSVQARIQEIKRNRPGGEQKEHPILIPVSSFSYLSCCAFNSGPDKKLRVCDVCGSYLSIFDSDK